MIEAVDVTKDLIQYNSISANSNVSIADCLDERLKSLDFTVERIVYRDAAGVEKVSLVARKGRGRGGLALLGHCDTVPADGWEFDPFRAVIRGDKLYGRGSCDMKGALACMLAAAEPYRLSDLKAPLYILFTSDEEVGCTGAKMIDQRSKLYNQSDVRYGVIGEPTNMEVIHAHKGAVSIRAVARGRAAHSSTGKGINANLTMIPFLVEMKAIYEELTTDPRHGNADFDPPYSDWNIGINDGGTQMNVTAPLSVCTVNYRPMPGQDERALFQRVRDAARRCGVDVDIHRLGGPFLTPIQSEVVQASLTAAGRRKAKTVPYGTDGLVFCSRMELVVLGPGDIKQAHTIDEWVKLEQLDRAVQVYRNLIERFCV
ncbi:MAG: M20 family metallopeptidase [Candidatus Latescibacteria bacterium]|nr:M20 family metallopeptidase [Candidatus Latescibacterota bacterium]